jgi:hypothetical protein
MNPDDPKPLPPETLALLRAEKGAVFAPHDARSRVLERLTSTFPGSGGEGGGGGNGGHEAVGPSAESVPPHRSIAWLARPSSLALAIAVGAVGGAAAWDSMRPAAKPRIIYVDRELPASSAAVIPSSVPPSSLPNPRTTSAKRPGFVVEGPAPATLDGQLAAERRLLDVARTALARGNGGDAFAAASLHGERYPNGALTEEREAMAIQALILLAKYDEARVRGVSFHRRFPGSVLAPAIDAALGAIP